MSTKLYAEFETVDELERQFMFVDTVPDMWPYIAGYTTRSEEARSALTGTLDVPYGPTRDEYLDIFPAALSAAPIMVFFHGGAWRMLSAKDYSFVARGLVAADITAILVNHSLCPKVGVDEIVRQARAAVAWTFRNARSFGGDPGRIYVAGHSAGAQLTAMCAITAWDKDYGLPTDIIKGGIPVSGVFDLTPFRYTSHQASLQLDGDIIARNSPCLLPVSAVVPPLFFSMGSNEPSALMQQVCDQFSKMSAARSGCELFEQPGLNHFQTVDGFESLDSELLKKVLAWIEKQKSC